MDGKYEKYAIKFRVPDPASAALLVVDMQEHFRGMAERILPAVRKMIGAARKRGMPVIYTQHSHKRPEEDGMLAEWWDGPGQIISAGTPAAALLPEVERADGDKVVPKHVYSAFVGSDLEAHLRKIGRSEVIIVGVMTNLCCETNARDAFCRGFRVFFSADATATAREDYHVATLKNLGYGFAYLVTVSGLKWG